MADDSSETEFEVDSRCRVHSKGTARFLVPFFAIPYFIWWCIGHIYIEPKDLDTFTKLFPFFLIPSLALLAPIVLGGSQFGWTRLISVTVSTSESGIITTRESFPICGQKRYSKTIPFESIVGIYHTRNFVTIQVKTDQSYFTRSIPVMLFGVKDPEGLVQLGKDLKLKRERDKYPTLESLLGQDEPVPPNWKRKSTV